MTVTVKNIIPAKYAENSQTTQYTSTSAKTILDKMTVTNITSSNAVFSVNLVPSGGSVANSNRVISLRTIAPGETFPCPGVVGQVLESGDFISTLSDTASALVLSAAGRVVT